MNFNDVASVFLGGLKLAEQLVEVVLWVIGSMSGRVVFVVVDVVFRPH